MDRRDRLYPYLKAKPAPQTAVPLEAIVFTRLAWGPTPEDVAVFRDLPGDPVAKLSAWTDQQLNPTQIDDSACDARLAALDLGALALTQPEAWHAYLIENAYKGTDREYEWKYRPTEDARAAMVVRAVYSRRQLFEVLVDFWHNHFNVYPHDHEEIFALFAAYDAQVIRKHALGNFREMLGAVARSGPMLSYLDNANSQDQGPIENYARELLELHTLGADSYLGVRDPLSVPRDSNGIAAGYVDNDVYEVARCFTGWTYGLDAEWLGLPNTGEFIFKRDWHDRFNKLVLGTYIRADQADEKDGDDVLDLLARHPGTARHIAKKLARRLIGDNPPARVVEEAAQVFLTHSDDPNQLREVARTIILSPEFRTTFGDKIRRPLEACLAMLRVTGAEFKHPRNIVWAFDSIGQPIWGRRPPDGFADVRTAWTHTVSMLYRWRFAIGLTWTWWKDEDAGYPLSIDLPGLTPESQRDPVGAVDYWSERALLRPMLSEHRRALIDLMSSGDDDSDEAYRDRLNRTVQLILMSPDFQLR
jgi:uncharacterized protein (DUF1800 family)